jgi:hypothetical protein
MVTGFLLSTPAEIVKGMTNILSSEGTLITDYFALAGPGAALVNSSLVVMISLLLLHISHSPVCGKTMITVGFVSCFSMFGKNILNIWPILIGAWLYAAYQKEPVMKYTSVGLLSTALSPIVSFMALRNGISPLFFGIAVFSGLLIGFVMPALVDYTFRIHNGMNLYNVGYASGLLAMLIVPLSRAMGHAPETTYYWSTEYHNVLLIYLSIILAALYIAAFTIDKNTLKNYMLLIKSRGHAPNDYIVKFEVSAVVLNTALVGTIALAYILLVGSKLNGPTLGGVFLIMSYGSNGKNPRNIIPIMLGVFIGSLLNIWEAAAAPVILSALFGTALAPIVDFYGSFAGLIAGFLHSSVALYAGGPLVGLNLYNNGFAAGLVATVMYPVLNEVLKHKRAPIDDIDYMKNNKIK